MSQTPASSFTGGADGGDLGSNLIFDAAGNLYGTTASGEVGGIVINLTPRRGWSEHGPQLFGLGSPSRVSSYLRSRGNRYGTTFESQGGYGLVFEITP